MWLVCLLHFCSSSHDFPPHSATVSLPSLGCWSATVAHTRGEVPSPVGRGLPSSVMSQPVSARATKRLGGGWGGRHSRGEQNSCLQRWEHQGHPLFDVEVGEQVGATLPSSSKPGLLMAPYCGKALEPVGTIPGAHSGCPLLPHRELSRSDLGSSDWNFDA